MFLIRKGEEPSPICVACRKADKPGAVVRYEFHVCTGCLRKLKNGEGLYIDPRSVRRAV